jgi:hypothetical protein
MVAKTYFRKKIGAFSPPSLLLEDFVGRFLVTVGLLEESVSDGTGLDMVRDDFSDTNSVGFANNICCMLFLLFILGMWSQSHCAVRERCGELNLERIGQHGGNSSSFRVLKNNY